MNPPTKSIPAQYQQATLMNSAYHRKNCSITVLSQRFGCRYEHLDVGFVNRVEAAAQHENGGASRMLREVQTSLGQIVHR
jgi:hypothetical protein